MSILKVTCKNKISNRSFLVTLLLMNFFLTACFSQKDTVEVLSPLPALTTESNIANLSYAENENEQFLTVHSDFDPTAEAQKDEPQKLTSLLKMEGTEQTEDTTVTQLRTGAIKETAQLVGFQTAMEWRYKQLIKATERYSAIMDTAFNFSPLLMTQGDTLIMPPVLTKAGASMRIEEHKTATTAKTTYEVLERARYISIVPSWRTFLLVDNFPKAESPNPALLPQNMEEGKVWRKSLREAWQEGVREAEGLYTDNVSHMVRTYRGITLYHLLTAQHLLSRVGIASSDLGLHTSDEGNKLHIGQKVYRITAPSKFLLDNNGGGK